MILVIDYGMGNLRSAQKGLEKSGHEAVVSSNPDDIGQADGILLPGVGAFKDCYDGLTSGGFVEPILQAIEADIPLLGICVGMQMLFEHSEEGEGSPGLGILKGNVTRFPHATDTGLKVPHMGWNRLQLVQERPCPILQNLSDDPYVYFVHSYHPVLDDDLTTYATATYGYTFPAVVGRDKIFGTQFHPEKSQLEGIGILKAFGDFVEKNVN
ncbi:MAG: imidazole glycerol phosphate synthase subunit HisH [Candidatus Hydrogenedentota bacterium]|nr:MAG: imidazole glycerol phosphate synthase subunit HisH [Candidatus Hydrogenedentota bacterium]